MPGRSILYCVAVLIIFGGTTQLTFAQDNIQENEDLARLPSLVRESPNHSDIFVQDDQIQKQQAAQAALMRQESIKRDSTRLFQLSAQLKDQIDKTNGDILSVKAIKMIQQIEKLAHGLKQKMKD
jgi:hypothetical protein